MGNSARVILLEYLFSKFKQINFVADRNDLSLDFDDWHDRCMSVAKNRIEKAGGELHLQDAFKILE